MAAVGDRVQVPSKRVGQAPRDGVVTGVSGGLLRVTWSTGEESTILPSMGSLVVVGKTRTRAKQAAPSRKVGSKQAPKKVASSSRKSATSAARKSAASTVGKAVKKPGKAQRGRATKPTSKGSGRAGKRKK